MSTVDRRAGLPVLVLVLGAIGSAFLVLGLLGLFAPESVGFAPILRESLVASALVASGAVFMVIEAVVILAWARRRRSGG